jgi:hypothetical protein
MHSPRRFRPSSNQPIEYTIDAIKHFCDYFKISHYALDVENRFCFKKVVEKSNYAALIYYIIDEHMYPVTDKKTRETIVNSASAKLERKTISSLLEKDGDFDDSEFVERMKLPYFVDVPLKELDNYRDCNIFYHKSNLHNKLLKLFVMKNTQYKSVQNGFKVVCIYYDNNVRLFANPNHINEFMQSF